MAISDQEKIGIAIVAALLIILLVVWYQNSKASSNATSHLKKVKKYQSSTRKNKNKKLRSSVGSTIFGNSALTPNGVRTADRTCQDLSQCNLQETFEIQAATDFSDRICVPLTVCGPDEYEAIAPTPTSDRVCEPYPVCPEGSFLDIDPNNPGIFECAPYPDCGSDAYLVINPDDPADFQCVPYPECGENQWLDVDPNDPSVHQCRPATECVVGESYETTPLDTYNDRVCSPVRPPCDPETEYQSQAPTKTVNRICAPLTECGPDQYEVIDLIAPDARVWTPADAGQNVIGWFDAGDPATLTVANGRVSSWADKSPNGFNMSQTIGAVQPFYEASGFNGNPGIRFDGVGSYLSNHAMAQYIGNGPGYFTFFIVMKTPTLSSNPDNDSFVFAMDAEAGPGVFNSVMQLTYLQADNTLATICGDNDVYTPFVPFSSENNILTLERSNRVTCKQYANGLLDATITANFSAAASYFSLGSRANGRSGFSNPTIAEIVVFPGAADRVTKLRMEGYLAHKWDLTGNLPADHPFKTMIPLVTGSSQIQKFYCDGNTCTTTNPTPNHPNSYYYTSSNCAGGCSNNLTDSQSYDEIIAEPNSDEIIFRKGVFAGGSWNNYEVGDIILVTGANLTIVNVVGSDFLNGYHRVISKTNGLPGDLVIQSINFNGNTRRSNGDIGFISRVQGGIFESSL